MKVFTCKVIFLLGIVTVSCFSFSLGGEWSWIKKSEYLRIKSIIGALPRVGAGGGNNYVQNRRDTTSKAKKLLVSDKNSYKKIAKDKKNNVNVDTQKSTLAPLVYTTGSTVNTSAGVYDGDVLIRTLWSNEKRGAGSYDLSNVWDGKDDKGDYVVDKKYIIRVTSGNVKYDWLRPLGNTSDSLSGPSVHNTGQVIMGMVQVNNTMYVARGYNEGGDAHGRFIIGKPNTLTTTLKGPGQTNRFLVTDGKTVFAGGQKNETTTYVAGIIPNKDGVDAIKVFTAGSTVTSQRLQYSGFDVTNNSYLTGLAVQQSGNFLFAAHSTLNQVRTIDKNTGAQVTSTDMRGVRHLAMQGDKAVWLSKMPSHSGSTTTQKLLGTVESSTYHKSDPPENAFDGKANAAFKSIGGIPNFLGIRFSKMSIITQVRMKAPSGVTQEVRVVGDDGWESVQLGKVVSTGSFSVLPIGDVTPLKGIRIEGLTDGGIQIDELEVYGYTYSGSPVVARHTVNDNGTIGGETLALLGITDPLSIAVSPDAKLVAVADRGINHQVKIYSTANGSLVRTIGRAENYSNPAVYDDKFYFNNTRNFNEHDYGQGHCFVAFQLDGSLWIGDYGNMRCQHFSADGVYIDNIQTMGYSYSCQADVNNPTRVFSDYLEFAVNYNNNSWQFVRNWSKNTPFQVNIDAERVRSVTTLANGRTYALYQEFGGNPRELIELDKSTGIRHTGLYLDTYNCDMFSDGSIWKMSDGSLDKPCTYQRKALIGFDGANNPVWGGYQSIETIQKIDNGDPITAGGILKRNQQTSSGVVATFSNDNGQDARARGYHLGGIKNGQWVFKASPSTHAGYLGGYPEDGAYDIGNGVQGAGTFMQTIGRHIFWGYHGEFWKNGQTNKYNHYLDNGLMVGQFGVSSDQTQGYPAYPGMAGNAFSGTYVKVGDDIHFFHCDESQHAGVHHWKISNLTSVSTQSFTIDKAGISRSYTSSCIDLMANVPTQGTVNGPVGRWTYNASTYRRGNFDEWSITAGTSTYKSADRSLRFVSYPVKTNQTLEAYCDLTVKPGTANNSQLWQLSGKITYPEVIEPFDNFIDVVDKSGKVIVRISRPDSYPNSSVLANSTTIVKGNPKQLYSKAQNISIQRIKDKLLVRLADYPEVSVSPFDANADLSSPAMLRIHFYSANTAGHQIDIANLTFCNTPAVVTPPTAAVRGNGTGLNGQYFNNRALTEPATVQRVDSTVNFNWGLTSPFPGQLNVDSFSIRWSGQVQAPVSGTYVFSTLCDDGVRLWIDGVQLINNWTYHATMDNSAPVTLVAGQKYDIRLEYYEGALGANVRLLWAYMGQAQQVIPAQQLYPAAVKLSNGRNKSDETSLMQPDGRDGATLVNVYPVPAHDYIWISYQALDAGNLTIKLVSASGQIVRQMVRSVEQGSNSIKMSVEALSEGLYLLQLEQGDTIITHRIILSN